jgi:hypothetical protein
LRLDLIAESEIAPHEAFLAKFGDPNCLNLREHYSVSAEISPFNRFLRVHFQESRENSDGSLRLVRRSHRLSRA